MGAGSSQPSENDEQAIVPQQDRRKTSNRRHSEETLDCPTCQGTGRIPRGQESKLVAVIPCSDQRLKPRHTVILSPGAVESVYVYFTPTTVQMNITNILNITNDNFFTVQAYNLTVQALFDKTVVGKADMKNVTTVKPLTDKTFSFEIPVTLMEEGLNNYCKKSTIKIHTLFVHLQMSMTVYYLAHFEQLSLDTYEYIDCGSNTTTPHIINPTP
ncbi:transmembrane protein 106B-like isoform X2 [Salvelinus fontinalis]|uniref:transmembrane protein 106B-like isoform X2 n=1 Tax=Salvelinus fontinalis TaxID=8038 RepID=UPI002485BD7E|nr:transmembrane protein 106B-like isoform X2 [Salvelinus fontinalis]